MGSSPWRRLVSLLGDARVSLRRQGQAGQAAQTRRSGSPTRARARALFAAGVLSGEQGNYESADALMRENLDIARQFQETQRVARSPNALAAHARDRGDLAVASSLFEESLGLWRGLDDQKAD